MKTFYSLFFLCLLVMVFVPASAQELVANINQTNEGSTPRHLTSNDRWTVFLAYSDSFKSHLYYIDGNSNEEDPKPVAFSGENLSFSTNLRLIEDVAYVTVLDGNDLLWMAADLETGDLTELIRLDSMGFYSTLDALFTVRGELFLIIQDAALVNRLYQSDGTPEGTIFLGNLPVKNVITEVELTDTLAFFMGATEGVVKKLWRSDGTLTGTFTPQINDQINVGRGSLGMAAYRNKIYYAATDGSSNFELHVSDGSPAGTRLFREIIPGQEGGGFPTDLQVVNDTLYFRTSGLTGGATFWKSDGTEEGTNEILDLPTSDDLVTISNLKVTPKRLYFSGRSSTDDKLSLWRSDRTIAGTFKIMDYVDSETPFYVSSDQIATPAGGLFFVAERDDLGWEFWYTEGSPSSTRPVADVYHGLEHGINLHSEFSRRGDRVYFSANNGTNGLELYSAKSRPDGAEMLLDINSQNVGSFPYTVLALGEKLLVVADNGCAGFELFSTEGDASSTLLLQDSRPGTASSSIGRLVKFKDKAYYINSNEQRGGSAIWQTDGTPQGTGLFYSFTSSDGFTSTIKSPPAALGDRLLLRGYLHGTGQVLLATNGNPETIETIKVLNAETGNSGSSSRMTPLNDSVLVFVEKDTDLGQELWRTDGTTEGTYVIKDVNPTNFNFVISSLKVIDGLAYFSIKIGNDRGVPHISDGTENGTVKMIEEGAFASITRAKNYFKFGELVYFTGEFGLSNYLFSINPSGEVEQVHSFGQDLLLVADNAFTVAAGKIYFASETEQDGNELWVIDAPGEEARLLVDLNPGQESAYPSDVTLLDSLVYFSARTAEFGRELYRTDGTEEGTVLVADINPGAAFAGVDHLYTFQGSLYFSANDGLSGKELWRYNPAGDYPENNPDQVVLFCTQDPAVATDDLEIPASELLVYPNPASGRVLLNTPTGNYSVSLITSSGQMILDVTYEGNEFNIDVSNYSSGLYLLRVYDKSSGRWGTRVVMVKD